ncbi:hypothetical protein GCM10029963_73090 [Micromonospora andamanensis]|nr:hypothetical protein Vwe01_30700 [Micromonospora andamanensis]
MRVKWFVPSGEESFKPFGLGCEGAALYRDRGEPTLNGRSDDTAVATDLARHCQNRRASPERPTLSSGPGSTRGVGRTRP